MNKWWEKNENCFQVVIKICPATLTTYSQVLQQTIMSYAQPI